MTACSLHAMASLTEAQVRRKPLVVMLGPTAVGKSQLAIEVAKRLETDILTADSGKSIAGWTLEPTSRRSPLGKVSYIISSMWPILMSRSTRGAFGSMPLN